MKQAIASLALVMRKYDEALDFYIQALGFALVKDSHFQDQDERRIVVAPLVLRSQACCSRVPVTTSICTPNILRSPFMLNAKPPTIRWFKRCQPRRTLTSPRPACSASHVFV
ncbi:MAG: VOC family protein [Cyanobacteria bacterium]|nr:VOC family protein [Cyanobacteriota bacterium]